MLKEQILTLVYRALLVSAKAAFLGGPGLLPVPETQVPQGWTRNRQETTRIGTLSL